MDFEFDPKKSVSNKDKHNVDFEFAKKAWNDNERIEGKAKLVGKEQRLFLIAEIEGKIWFVTFLPRDGKTRIVSCRRAREAEERIYYV